MNKADLSEILADCGDISKVRAAQYIDIVTDDIRESLAQGEKVTISDFGTFSASTRNSFTGHNPRTGAAMGVPSRTIPVFRAGKALKNALNP